MRNDTRALFNKYTARIALLSGVASSAVMFTVEPSVAQKLEEKTQATSEFLTRINFYEVDQQEGEKVGIGITGTIAGRTNTANADRQPIDPTGLTANSYRCEQTNFDTALKYAKLDAWRHKPEFQTIIRDAILKRQGLDRMLIGWNGTSVAAQTDRAANPLLQDVNKGWIQHVREDAPARVLDDGALSGAGKAIYVAAGAVGVEVDYVNLDALVFDAIELLEEPYRDDTELVVIVGRDLVHDKYFNIVNAAGDKATEQLARDVLLSTKKIGGLPAVRVPGFPAGKLCITRLDNLSVYNQSGTRRRAIIDNPKRNQVENFESVNEAYVVEDYGIIAVVENIVMGKKPA
ncbi:MAG TPA: phage major capsid protein, P2 family [Allosphingosinicella sp.]|uniref:phage major capsid protein, P2 family n=1 Tax=Allosphingosinicella sp. TaxID=2823234 RepID=UPI002ED84BB0